MFLSTSRLPPALEYPDEPYVGRRNRDDVQMRTIRAGWNALYSHELTDLSFYALAREVGVTGPALYRYHKSITALGIQLAHLAVGTLLYELTLGLPPVPPPPDEGRRILLVAVSRYLYFAQKRPRHFSLICSGQYLDRTDPEPRDADLLEAMRRFLTNALEREATPAEGQGLLALVHGAASMLAVGFPPNSEQTLAAVNRYIDGLEPRGDPH